MVENVGRIDQTIPVQPNRVGQPGRVDGKGFQGILDGSLRLSKHVSQRVDRRQLDLGPGHRKRRCLPGGLRGLAGRHRDRSPENQPRQNLSAAVTHERGERAKATRCLGPVTVRVMVGSRACRSRRQA